MRGYWQELRSYWDPVLTAVLLWALRKVNPHKDNRLAHKLHDMADQYDTRPTGAWQ